MSISKNKFAAPVIVLSSICLVVSLALAFTYKIANPIAWSFLLRWHLRIRSRIRSF